MDIRNVIKKDIQNIQTLFLRNEDGKEMYSLIVFLEQAGYDVIIQVKPNQEIKGLFFIHKDAIKEAQRWPEAITVDATYKTNAHKMSLVNIVGTSNVSSSKGAHRLQTFAIAAAFIISETEATYTWIMEELRNAVWFDDEYKLPSVFVTDNEQALINAVEFVFPESQHFLCTWHLSKTMETKLPIGKAVKEQYDVQLILADTQLKVAMCSHDEETFKKSYQQVSRNS